MTGFRLVRRHGPVADQGVRDGVIGGELLDAVAADEIGPAVAQAGDVNLIVLLEGEDGGGAHLAVAGLLLAGLDDGLVGFVERLQNRVTGVVMGVEAILEDARDDVRGQAAGLLSALLTAHAVGDEEQVAARVGDEPILVIGPPPLGAAAADLDDEFRHENLPRGEAVERRQSSPGNPSSPILHRIRRSCQGTDRGVSWCFPNSAGRFHPGKKWLRTDSIGGEGGGCA